MNLTPSIKMLEHRCYMCGSFWCLEEGKSGRCPVCAGRLLDTKDLNMQNAVRSLRAYKAAAKRRKSEKTTKGNQ